MNHLKNKLFFIFAIDVVIVLLHIFFGLDNHFFNLDKEKNLPSAYSTLKLFFIGFIAFSSLFLVKYYLKEKIGWLLFSGLFFYLAFDEFFEIHEKIADKLAYWKLENLNWYDNVAFYWTFILAPLILGAIIFLFLFIKKFLKENKEIRKFFIIGSICFILVIILEVIGGLNYQASFYNYLVIFEESFEIFGASLFLLGVIFYIKQRKMTLDKTIKM